MSTVGLPSPHSSYLHPKNIKVEEKIPVATPVTIPLTVIHPTRCEYLSTTVIKRAGCGVCWRKHSYNCEKGFGEVTPAVDCEKCQSYQAEDTSSSASYSIPTK